MKFHHRRHIILEPEMDGPTDNTTFHSKIPVVADVTLGIVYSIFGVCSLCGNSVLLYVSYKKKHLLKPAEFFIVNLAVSDLGMTLSLYPLAVTASFFHRWLFGWTACAVYAFCGVLFGLCSLTTLTLLSTVCCLKVCYPLYGNRFSSGHSLILIACSWAYALIFACSPLAYWGRYGPEPYGTACCIDWAWSNHNRTARSYTAALFICCYLLPCTIIILSYTHILFTVRESRRAVEQHISTQTRMGNIQTIIVKLSVAVCVGFFTAWSPYALVSMWAAFGRMEDIPPLAFAVPAMFAKSSTLYNPLVYLLLKPNFRHLLYQDVGSLCDVCVRRCHLCACLPRCSYRSVLAASLRSLRRRAESSSGSTQVQEGVCQCSCERCNDPFERFKRYPQRCPINVNTVQLSLQEPEPELRTEPKSETRPMAGRTSVCVIVRGKKNFEIDNLEITLETVPTHGNAAKP